MNIKQYQKQADEYEKYLERIAELAENNIKKSARRFYGGGHRMYDVRLYGCGFGQKGAAL